MGSTASNVDKAPPLPTVYKRTDGKVDSIYQQYKDIGSKGYNKLYFATKK